MEVSSLFPKQLPQFINNHKRYVAIFAALAIITAVGFQLGLAHSISAMFSSIAGRVILGTGLTAVGLLAWFYKPVSSEKEIAKPKELSQIHTVVCPTNESFNLQYGLEHQTEKYYKLSIQMSPNDQPYRLQIESTSHSSDIESGFQYDVQNMAQESNALSIMTFTLPQIVTMVGLFYNSPQGMNPSCNLAGLVVFELNDEYYIVNNKGNLEKINDLTSFFDLYNDSDRIEELQNLANRVDLSI